MEALHEDTGLTPEESATRADGPAAVPLAVVGIGCLFPGAEDLRAYWSNIVNRVDGITDVPPSHWRSEDYLHPDPKAPDRIYTARGGFLDPIDFDALEFGVSPNNIEATDASQLLALTAVQQALQDAGYGPGGRAFDRKHRAWRAIIGHRVFQSYRERGHLERAGGYEACQGQR